MKKLFILAAGMMLAGCITDAGKLEDRIAAQRAPSPAIKQLIINEAQNILLDPYSVRDVSISSLIPNLKSSNNDGFICVRFNAKNSYGAYTGLKTVGTNVISGRLLGYFTNPAICAYPTVKWHPLPEVSQLRKL
ncbi:hypothetical protein ABC425_14665 [Brucella melitensis]|uniref:hypothetical protein n=1 Tax=Brucella melitensis TaxID=29459 RepID=UPI0031FD52C3